MRLRREFCRRRVCCARCGAERHVWNPMRLVDNRYYCLDVDGCDGRYQAYLAWRKILAERLRSRPN